MADQAGEALEEIVASIDEVKERADEIAAASEEQSTTSEEIARSVQSISTAARESAHGVTDVSSAAGDLDALTDRLRNNIQRFHLENEPSREGSGPAGSVPAETESGRSDSPEAAAQGRPLRAG